MRIQSQASFLFIGFIVIFFCLTASAQQLRPFKAGDKVMFVGNSITNAGYYHSYIWLYYMTRYPDNRITIINRGIGGNDIGQMNERLDIEVFPEDPTVIVLTFGMNDSGYFEYFKDNKDSVSKAKVEWAYRNYLKTEQQLKMHPDVRKIIMSTAPYDETTTSTKNNLFTGKKAAIDSIAAFQERSAKQNHWAFIDLNRLMQEINVQQQKNNPAFSLSPGDRIHPDLGGHLVMAYFFLKEQGLANKKIADISIDARQKKLLHAGAGNVAKLRVGPTGISFDYLASALPFPIDTLPRIWNSKSTQADALTLVPFMEEFNQELITIKNLEQGNYILKIDGQAIGTWSAKDFAAGINLAAQMNTPQYQQAIQIRDLNEERMEIEKRFRQYNWVEFEILKPRGLLRKHDQAALDTVRSLINTGFVRGNYENWTKARTPAIREAWTAQMKILEDKIYEINKPVLHHISIHKLP